MTETYKDIPGYPGYRVGSFGTVWSSWKRGKCGYGWKQLKPSKHKQGYLYVDLYKEGVKSRFLVHTLVLTSFVGPCPLGMECRHLDRNVANNHDWNLKWGTPTENQQDRVLHGTSNRGEQHGRAFLSDADVLDMRQKCLQSSSLKNN